MHTIKLQVTDNAYAHIMYLLQNLKTDDLKIIEDREDISQTQETLAFANHSANLIDEWKDESEDEVWK